jgi:hydrogenase maturation protease
LNNQKLRILIYGYGNPGRQDDGLGVLLAEEIDKWAVTRSLSAIRTDSNYQLNIEDASAIAGYDLVVFADASGEEISDYLFEELKPSASTEFTMHAVSPAFILHLCGEVFDKKPEAYLLHIKGYKWEFMAETTDQAKQNLGKAISYLQNFLLKKLKIE